MQVTNASGASGSLAIDFSAGTYNNVDRTVSWSQSTLLPIIDPSNGQLVATLRSASIYARLYPPKINLNFSLDAGASNTIAVIDSPWLSFPQLTAADSQGKAFASFTIADRNNDGASLISVGPAGTGMYQAVINGMLPEGLLFSQLVAQVTVSSGGTLSGYQYDPPTGYRPLQMAVTEAGSRIAFSVTAGDRASGTTRYDLAGEANPAGDLNCDGRINFFDIDPFILALLMPPVYDSSYPGCPLTNADCDYNGVVNNFDVDRFLDFID